jgi:hypothetical protein
MNFGVSIAKAGLPTVLEWVVMRSTVKWQYKKWAAVEME